MPHKKIALVISGICYSLAFLVVIQLAESDLKWSALIAVLVAIPQLFTIVLAREQHDQRLEQTDNVHALVQDVVAEVVQDMAAEVHESSSGQGKDDPVVWSHENTEALRKLVRERDRWSEKTRALVENYLSELDQGSMDN